MKTMAPEQSTGAIELPLSEVINFLPDPCFAIDLQGRVIAWNQAIADLSGILAEDMLGRDNYEYANSLYGIRRPILIDLALNWDEKIAHKYKYIKENSDTLVCETESLQFKPEKSRFWSTARRIYNAKGECVGALEIILEKTHREKSADKLRKSESDITLMLNTTSEHVSFYDSDLRIQWLNKATAESLGRDASDLIGYFCYQVRHNRTEPCERCPVVKAKITGKPQKAEITAPDGRVWLVRGYPVFDESGKVSNLVEFTLEITELKRAEAALQHRLAFEQLVAKISNRFANIESDKLDSAINELLADIGRFTRTDRSYLIVFSEDLTTSFNTHEWCAQGIKPEMQNLQDIPVTPLKWWMQKMKAGENIIIQSVADLPHEAQTEKELFQAQDILSLLAVPVYCGSRLFGFIGFDSVRKHKNWINDDIQLLRTVSHIVSSAIQRIHNEQALRQSEKKFSRAFADSPSFMFISDFESGEFIEVNRAYCDMSGYLAEELIGHTSVGLNILKSTQLVDIKKHFEQAGKLKNFECHIRTKSGDMKTTIVSAALVELNGKKCIVASGMDITERKQVEIDLKKSEFEKSLILDSTSEFIAYFDIDMRLQWANKAWLESLRGVGNLQSITGQECHLIRYNRSEPCAGCPVSKTRSTGMAEEAKLEMADGRILHIRSYPVHDDSNKLVAIIDFSKDITDQKRAEQALKTAHDELEEKVLLRTAELDNRNKEIRNLAHLTIRAMENDRKALSKELHDSIGGTLAAIKYQLESRLEGVACESAEIPLEKIITYIGDTIQETRRVTKRLRPSVLDDFGLVAAMQEHLLEFKQFYPKTKISIQISDAVESLSSDAKTVVYRVLQEALNNVGKHSNAKEVDIRCQCHSGWVTLKINDNGRGFDTREFFGSKNIVGGYGLHSMRERVEICKGKFQIESAPGRGTTILVTLPMQSD